MTTPRDPDRLVQAFLEEGPAVLPDRVLDAVRDDIHETDQRVVFGLWRTITMPRAFATAAVIAVVAIGGVAYLATRSQGPDVGSTPNPSQLAPSIPPAPHGNGPIVVIDGGLLAINSVTGKEIKNLHLPDAPHATDATWSPDGKQLAYTAPGGLWVVEVSTGELRQIMYCGMDAYACFPAWSPDGARIAVADGHQLKLIDPDGGNPTTLPAPEGPIQPTWSPDGRQIAFQAVEGYGTDPQIRRLYVINRDGSDLSLLLDQVPGIGAWDPSWSPDGSAIAYIGSRPTGKAPNGAEEDMMLVMLLELNGSEPRELVEAGPCACIGYAPGLTWSPDGKSLAVNAPGDDFGLYLVNVDGTDFHRVGYGALSPAWRPVP
jgi:Tol biopolymer transport system component